MAPSPIAFQIIRSKNARQVKRQQSSNSVCKDWVTSSTMRAKWVERLTELYEPVSRSLTVNLQCTALEWSEGKTRFENCLCRDSLFLLTVRKLRRLHRQQRPPEVTRSCLDHLALCKLLPRCNRKKRLRRFRGAKREFGESQPLEV